MKPIFELYNLLWMSSIPFLISFPRLRYGWKERIFINDKGPFDLWIHAASVGEAYMLNDLIENLPRDLKIMATTNTSQGKEIIREKNNIHIRYLPFDLTFVWEKALSIWRPKLLVLLETELWPALLYTCLKSNIPVLLLNARLSKKSFKRYMKFKALFKKFPPKEIYAISEEDAKRYKELFGKKDVRLMNNMKFDRLNTNGDKKIDPVVKRFLKERKFIVFGSIRKEEERDILYVIKYLLQLFPCILIGVFPRHIERVNFWKNMLEKEGIRYALRSELNDSLNKIQVILWDMIGELQMAYSLADVAFVGGSLRPCGGQNFLEPLSYGVVPCVGPFTENFNWVGDDLFEMGLVIKVKDSKELLRTLSYRIISPAADRDMVKNKFGLFLKEKKGGIRTACHAILKYLDQRDTFEYKEMQNGVKERRLPDNCRHAK